MASGLDLADKLAEYAGMNASDEIDHSEVRSPATPRLGRPRRAVWAIGLLAAAIVSALAFAAYRQPELLLNIMGLRYCG